MVTVSCCIGERDKDPQLYILVIVSVNVTVFYLEKREKTHFRAEG